MGGGTRVAESDADKAYEAAEAAIEQARSNKAFSLVLWDLAFRDLDKLPPELAKLENLQIFRLPHSSNISDLTPIAGLERLHTLTLRHSRVKNLAPLAGLTRLKELRLDNSMVSDVSPLVGLTALRVLNLSQSQISDLSPIVQLPKLYHLDISGTAVQDFTHLAEMTKLAVLDLSNTAFSDPTLLANLRSLQILRLRGTKVHDLAPLADLTEMRHLTLANTQIEDISALQTMFELRSLILDDTKVSDLRPIMRLGKLGSETYSELSFKGTPFARGTYDLSRMSRSGFYRKRTRDTLAYLKTLPPWPEPLPWQKEPVTPEPDAVPTISASPSGIDLAHSPLDEVDKADPIKRRIYDKLPDAVAALLRHGNRYPEVKGPSDALRELVAVAFEDADLLDIHLQIAALTDVREQDQRKPAQERLDADCLAALNTVLRLGPPVTIGHPDVDLLEKRSAEYARNHLPDSVSQGERRIAAGIEKAPEIAGERLRRTAGQVAKAPNEGRVAEYRRPLNRNMIIALASLTGMVGDAVVGYVPGEIVQAAAQFLWLHRAEIMSTAPAWGESGGLWLSYMLARAQEIVDEARQA